MLSRFIFAPATFYCILLFFIFIFKYAQPSFPLSHVFQFLWPNILAAVSRSMSEHNIFKAWWQELHIIYYSASYDLISQDVTVSEDASSCHTSLQMESMWFHYKGLLSSSACDSQHECSKMGKQIQRRCKIFASSCRILETTSYTKGNMLYWCSGKPSPVNLLLNMLNLLLPQQY